MIIHLPKVHGNKQDRILPLNKDTNQKMTMDTNLEMRQDTIVETK